MGLRWRETKGVYMDEFNNKKLEEVDATYQTAGCESKLTFVQTP